MAFEKSKKERQLLLPDQMPRAKYDPEMMTAAEEVTLNAPIADLVQMEQEPMAFKARLAELQNQLQLALELEHSTIPPYLCALYSIKPGTNLIPGEIIKSVVLEEMLHMIMVANLINAVGGTPKIGQKEKEDGHFVPSYPTHLPGGVDEKLFINLTYFSKESIRTFWKIEHPVGNFQLPKEFGAAAQKYASIGEFYDALLKNIVELETIANLRNETIFTGDPARQVSSKHYYGAGGKLFTVSNLKEAEQVIGEIVGQGEGTLGTIFTGPYDPMDPNYLLFGPNVGEYAHYFRFKEVFYGRFYAVNDSAHRDSHNCGLPTGEKFEVDWEGVCKMHPNPKLEDYPKDSDLYHKSAMFSNTYSELLDNLNDGCNGNQEVLTAGIQLMYKLKYQAVELMNIPYKDGFTAGPTFQYIEKNLRIS